jgi:hypothetical protein
MKKTIILLALSVGFLCSCDKYSKVSRTVTKNILLNYNIDQVGSFSSIAIIPNGKIIQLFNDNDNKFSQATIEKIDIQSISIGASVASNNTAKQVQIGATIQSYFGKKVLLNDSKLLQIESGIGSDALNAFGAVTGLDNKNITLHNAIDLINATGAADLSNALQKNLKAINVIDPIQIMLNGKVPQNQRFVMPISIQIAATITYSTCEKINVFIAGGDNCGLN